MTQRLTSEWTENSEQAFGETGRIGDAGELEVGDRLKQISPTSTVIHNPSDYDKQIKGHDISLITPTGKEIGIDVKTNLHAQYNNILVDVRKISKSQATLWIHWDKTEKKGVMYKVADMLEYIATEHPRTISRGECYNIPRRLSFVAVI